MRLLGPMVVLVAVVLGTTLGARAAQFDTGPFEERVVMEFSDGVIMDDSGARCVADDVADSVNWEAAADRGLEPADMFAAPLFEHLSGMDVDALVAALDDCRGAGPIVLQIFETQGAMEDVQLGCFASQMSAQSALDLLRLIVADDVATFMGSEGEILLGVCGRGASA